MQLEERMLVGEPRGSRREQDSSLGVELSAVPWLPSWGHTNQE